MTDPRGLDELRAELLAIVREHGYRRLPEPIQLASGRSSRDFVDAKRALARGAHLALACEALVALAAHEGVDFDAVGGPTMGADQFAHGVAVVADTAWFVVRKAPKGRGTDRLVEGAPLAAGTRVFLVDDVVSTGGSILRACEAVEGTGASIVLASTLVDRGDNVAGSFAERGVRYRPLLTYRDLGIEPIGPA